IGVRIGPRVTVGQGLKEGDDLVLFLIGEPEVTKFLTQVLTNLRGRPAGRLFAGVALFASRQGVACIVEVDKLLETLQIAVVHVRLHERGTWSDVHVAQSLDLHFAVKLQRERYPCRVRVDPVLTSQETPNPQVGKASAGRITRKSELIWYILEIKRITVVSRDTKVGRGKIGKKWRDACGVFRRHRRVRVVRRTIQMAHVALSFASEQVPTCHLVVG